MSLTLLTFSSCGFGKSKDRSLEAAFSQDASMVFVADYTSDNQVANLNKVISQFPVMGTVDTYKKLFDDRVMGENLSWDQDLGPIFKGKWKVGVSVTFPEGDDLSKGDIFFAGKFSESKQITVLLTKLIANRVGFWEKVKYEKTDGVEYWTDDSSKIYLALNKDIFVISQTAEDRKATIKRIDANDGLDQNSQFKNYISKSSDRLMYGYVGPKTYNSKNSFFSKLFGEKYMKLLEAMKGNFVEVVVTEDGLKFLSKTNIDPKSAGFNAFVPNPDYKISLVAKVNSKGLFYYTEASGFTGGILELLMADDVVNAGKADAVDGGSLQTNVLGALGMGDDTEVLSAPATSVGTSGNLRELMSAFVQKIKFILDSPHAISISDKGNFLPAIAFYFQLKNDDVEKAKGLLTDLDAYVDEVVLEVNKVMPAADGQTSSIKKDLIVSNGGALHKVFVDWKAVPQAIITDWSTKSGIDVTSVKNEFYYGLMGDNVFVIAWYPDFPDAYGKDVLSQDADYKEAFNKLDAGYGMSVSYVNTKPLVTFLDKFLKMAVTLDSADESGSDVALGYVQIVEKFISTVKYAVASSGYQDGQISAESFMKVEKVQD